MKDRGPNITSLSGFIGSAFAALCCIGSPVLIGALGAIGAGFLINDKILLPLLALSLLLSVFGLLSAYRRRHRTWPLVMGLLGVLGTVGGIITVFTSTAPGGKSFIYIGLSALFVATIKNIIDGAISHHGRTGLPTG